MHERKGHKGRNCQIPIYFTREEYEKVREQTARTLSASLADYMRQRIFSRKMHYFHHIEELDTFVEELIRIKERLFEMAETAGPLDMAELRGIALEIKSITNKCYNLCCQLSTTLKA